jgi:hypothetical protein
LARLWGPHRRGARVGVDLGFHLRDGRLDIFEFQLILGRIDLLGLGPEERLFFNALRATPHDSPHAA